MGIKKPKFKLRVAGIALKNDQVLLQNGEGNDYWSLPGGRIEMMERSELALVREIQEEFSVEVNVGRMLAISESIFARRERPIHEICFYYLMFLSDKSPMMKGKGPFYGKEKDMNLLLQWTSLRGLNDLNIVPDFLKRLLLEIPLDIVHVVSFSDEDPLV